MKYQEYRGLDMNYEEQCELMTKWADGERDFCVESLDEKERKLNLRISNTDILLSITVPADDNESWLVWSESEKILPLLQDIQDFLASSRKRTVTEILDNVKTKILDKVKAGCIKSGDDNENNSDDGISEDGDFDDYYDQDDDDDDDIEGETTERGPKTKEDEEDDDEGGNFFGSDSSCVAVQRLMKDLKAFRKDGKKFGLDGGPRNDNLFLWDIKLIDIPESKLSKDLETFAKRHNTEPCINLEMMFPPDYPMSPPFVRVTTPRFKFLTGHVTIGGSICMEMLTKSGWMPTNDIENILVQIRCEILSDPNAQLDLNNAHTAYTQSEARAAFQRMVQRYGWDKS